MITEAKFYEQIYRRDEAIRALMNKVTLLEFEIMWMKRDMELWKEIINIRTRRNSY